MYTKRPENIFDSKSINCWHEKMSGFDRSFFFKKDVMIKGRMIWATNVIQSITLKPDCVVAAVKYNNEDYVLTFDINSNGLLTSNLDLKDKKSCSVIYAVCLEIDKILAEVPANTEEKVEEQKEEVVPVSKINKNKYLLVKIFIDNQNLVMRSYLDNDERKPIFMQSNRALSMISGDERKISILRLLFNAKKANCKFCFEHRDYRISNLRDALTFYTDKLPVWEKYFNVELSTECELLSRGLLDIVTHAKITSPAEGQIEIIWQMSTKYGEISNEHLAFLLKANGRPVFFYQILESYACQKNR